MCQPNSTLIPAKPLAFWHGTPRKQKQATGYAPIACLIYEAILLSSPNDEGKDLISLSEIPYK
jgi:hypothetical protein